VTDTRDFITKDLDEIRAHYDLPDEHLFSFWVMSFYHWDSDFSETTLEEIYNQSYELLVEGPPGDGCLDGYYFDSDSNNLYLYQTKWPEKHTKAQSNKDAQEIATALQLLDSDSNNPSAELPEVRREVVAALDAVKESSGRIILRSVSGGKWRTGHHQQVVDAVPTALKKFVEVELSGLLDLRDQTSQKTEDLKGRWTDFGIFGNTPDPILHYPSTGVPGMSDALVVLASGLSVAELANSLGTRLFDRNVRHFLKGNKVNKDIQTSLQDPNQRKAFWYGHNGITLLCDDHKIVGEPTAPTAIKIQNPQIVNGCQTATTLKECFGDRNKAKPVDDFALLARIIKLEGTEEEKADAAGEIAYWTNNQAAINDADLRANDKPQKFYQMMVKDFGKKWFYERKRGEFKAGLTKGQQQKFKSPQTTARLIPRDFYQQAWRSYSGNPSDAVTNKNKVWARGHGTSGQDLYGQVFDLSRRAADVVLVSVLFDWYLQVWSVKRDETSLAWYVHKGLGKHAAEVRRAKTLVAAHSVALHGHAVRQAYGSLDKYPEKLINKLVDELPRGRYVSSKWKKNCWNKLGQVPAKIMLAWSLYIPSVKYREETLYGALKGSDAFPALVELLDGSVETDYADWFTG
jgi:hypothetical protein